MKNLTKELMNRMPKVVSNLLLALIFWFIRFIVLTTLKTVNSEILFLLQTALLIVMGIFLFRALFISLNLFDRLTGSFLNRLGIKENWSRQRIFKDTLCIVAIILVAATLVPVFETFSNFELLLQITTYVALSLMLIFVFDIGRNFYRLTEEKANSIANRISNSNIDEEK